MFARPAEMEPGMYFRSHDGGQPLLWGGVESVVSRFPGKHRVRVIVLKGGTSFVCDAERRFAVVDWNGGRG